MIAAFVHQPVMMAAELHEVVEARLATVGPVLDVVAVDVTRAGAAREAAAAVAGVQCAAHCRWVGA